MSLTAKLVHGSTYHVMGHNFVNGAAQEVSEEVFNYLQGNAQFEFNGESVQGDQDGAEGLKELLAKNRKELDELATDLELNPDDYKNKEEIAKAILEAEAALDEE